MSDTANRNLVTRRRLLGTTASLAAVGLAAPLIGLNPANAAISMDINPSGRDGTCFVDHEAFAGSLYHNIRKENRATATGAHELHKARCPICQEHVGAATVGYAAVQAA